MSYRLPTLASLRRQNVPVQRRNLTRGEPPSEVCEHRNLRRFAGGRCPMCYRQSLREYGRTQRRRLNRPRPRQREVVRLPSIQPSTFYNRLMIPSLPGNKVYGSSRDTCSICMNTYESDRACQELPCTHRFHSWCYQKWYIKKRNCPLCRANFD